MEYDTAMDLGHAAGVAAGERIVEGLHEIESARNGARFYEYAFLDMRHEVIQYGKEGWRLHTVIPPVMGVIGVPAQFIMEREIVDEQ